MSSYLCPICSMPGRVCGDDHMTRPPITSDILKGAHTMTGPLELKEYEYMVGHVPVTAMLTDDQAERLKATAVGDSKSPGTGNVVNNEAQRQVTHHREADERGTATSHPDGTNHEDVAGKAATARNKRAS